MFALAPTTRGDAANILTAGPTRSYYVLMDSAHDRSALTFGELASHDTVIVRCECGWIVEFLPGVLPRLHRVKPSAVISELRFHCTHCGRRSGLAISLRDERHRGDNALNHIERVIVPKRKV